MNVFVLKSPSGKYIAIDDASGGYPYEVAEWNRATLWTDVANLLSYKKMFQKENYKICTIIPNIIAGMIE